MEACSKGPATRQESAPLVHTKAEPGGQPALGFCQSPSLRLPGSKELPPCVATHRSLCPGPALGKALWSHQHLWLCSGEFDEHTVSNQNGYLLLGLSRATPVPS